MVCVLPVAYDYSLHECSIRLCNCCFVASSVLAISIASSSDSVSSLWISFDCTCSECLVCVHWYLYIYILVPKCMRSVFIYASTLSPLSCFIDLNLNLAILKLLLGDAGNNDDTQALVQLKIQSPQCTNQLICKLDTGSEGNIIPLTTYKTMSPHCNVTQDGIPTNLHRSNMRITAYGGHTVTHYGTCELQITRNESVLSTFHVVKSNGPTIIGLPHLCDLSKTNSSLIALTPTAIL